MNAPAKAKGDATVNMPNPESSDGDRKDGPRQARRPDAAPHVAQVSSVAQLRNATHSSRKAAAPQGLDRWFDDQLNRLFDDVSSEPLPPELRPQRRRQKAVERGEVDMETGEVMA